jgi:hypothetical protein
MYRRNVAARSLPLYSAMLFDKSRSVRHFVTRLGEMYPLELVISARAREKDPVIRDRLEKIAERIAEHRLASDGIAPVK